MRVSYSLFCSALCLDSWVQLEWRIKCISTIWLWHAVSQPHNMLSNTSWSSIRKLAYRKTVAATAIVKMLGLMSRLSRDRFFTFRNSIYGIKFYGQKLRNFSYTRKKAEFRYWFSIKPSNVFYSRKYLFKWTKWSPWERKRKRKRKTRSHHSSARIDHITESRERKKAVTFRIHTFKDKCCLTYFGF